MYEYPGRYLTQEAGAARAQLLLQSAELPQTRLTGKAYSPALTAEYTIDLTVDVSGSVTIKGAKVNLIERRSR